VPREVAALIPSDLLPFRSSSGLSNVLGVTVNIVLIAHLRGDFHMTPDTRTNFLNVIARR
jgi:hypothetical protein